MVKTIWLYKETRESAACTVSGGKGLALVRGEAVGAGPAAR